MKEAAPNSRWSRLPVIGPVVRLLRGHSADAELSNGPLAPEVKTYHCGTLTYTKAGLLAIFAWLLWGDFCYTLMEVVAPTVLPLKLKALASPNWLTGLIITTVPNILNMTICPAVSFKSDRYRGRWGRRIPFIVWTLPFLCLSLVLLGCSEQISVWLQAHMPSLRNVAPVTVTIALIGIFMVMFQFFNMFVGSVFNYLLNDVVPTQHLSRFIGSFRTVGNLAYALYQYFIFQYAGTHMREILVGGAVIYFVGFAIMCVMVKEGKYPPVEGEDEKAARGLRGVKTFLKESFCHKWYWIFFAWNSIWALGAGIGIFAVFFSMEMGLTLDDIGKLAAVGLVAAMAATYLASIFVDRWHPMRVMVYAQVFVAFAAFSGWVWVFVTLPGRYYFWLSLGTALTGAFFTAFSGVCGYPLLMRTFPKSRFGQFCAAQAMVRSLLSLVAGVAAGLFVDGVAWLCRHSGHTSDFAYRFNFLWSGVFTVAIAAFGIWAYVYWHRLGADQGYQPPAPWSPRKTEDMDIVPTVGPQSRWLSLSLRLFDAIMWTSVLCLPVLIWWMHQSGALIAARWYTLLVLPYSLAVWVGWKLLERGIRRDMARSLRNEPLHNGIPHHGMLMVVSVQYLLTLCVWIFQVVVTVKLGMEWECIVFGVGNVITNLMLTAAVLAIWRMERGRSTTLYVEDATAVAPLPSAGMMDAIKSLLHRKASAAATE